MKANTALSLLLLGCAGAMRERPDAGRVRKTLSLVAAAVVLAIAVLTLAEYVLAIDLHVDQLFVSVPDQSVPYPGRSSPPTALAHALLAAAIFAFDGRSGRQSRPSEWLILAAAAVAFTNLMGLVFGAGPLYELTDAPVTGVALPTALGQLLICLGLLLERPAAGLMSAATSSGPGGVLLRRLGLSALLAPLLFGLAIMRMSAAVSLAELAVVVGAVVSMMTFMSLLLLTITAMSLDRTQAALESSRAQTRNLVELAPDGIFVADLEGRYTDVNDAGCNILGRTRADIVGKTILDLIPPEDAARLWQSRDRMLAGEVVVDEWRLLQADGNYVPVEVSARILPDGRWQGFVRDISERKRLAKELQVSEARASGILSISVDAIISVDEQQRITSFNEGAEKIFGYTKDEAIGAPLERLIPERFRAVHRTQLDSFAAGREIARKMGDPRTPIFGLHKDGREFPVDATISKLQVAGRKILTVALRDNTEAKRVESEHRFLADVGALLATNLEYEETIARFAELAVQQLADVCIVDVVQETGGIERLKVVSRDPARAKASDALQLIPRDAAALHPLRTVLATRQPFLIADVAGKRLPAWARELGAQSLMAVPLLVRDTLLGMVTFVSVTPSRQYGPSDLRLAEELAHRAALSIENARLYGAAERAIKARDAVLGVVAHDLRSPLGTILMQAGMLRRVGPERDQRAGSALDRIERAAKRMNRLIQDLLDVTRMEAGRFSLERQRLRTAQVVHDVLDAHQSLAVAGSLELRSDAASDLPEVWADRDRLLQVFENLIGNALKFTPPGGSVTLSAAPRGDEVLFCVSDTGAGIAADDLPHVFDRFWQARGTAKLGAGLGLPIVKGIVEAHGGHVWVDSTPGHGSTFCFTIPTAHRTGAFRPEPARGP
jgi:PAS domain S-box-containing protein